MELAGEASADKVRTDDASAGPMYTGVLPARLAAFVTLTAAVCAAGHEVGGA